MTYALLALIVLVLLGGLVAFGVGHQRWSWGTLIAAILVLLTAAGYLYVASRFAAYEWSWANFVRSKKVQLAKVRDSLVPDPSTGRLTKMAGGEGELSATPIADLVTERERWQRVLDRVDTWRDRSWARASFVPPKADGATGKLEIPFRSSAPPAAEGAAEGEVAAAEPAKPGNPPLDAGATVYLFEDVPAQEGGRYLGAFRVDSADVDAAAGQYVFAVVSTEPRDSYDTDVWGRSYDSVTVYETLPTDRWSAFSKTATAAGDAPPSPTRLTLEQVEQLLEERDRQRAFLAEYEKHETVVEKDEWERIRERLEAGEEQPGSYWARLTIKEPTVIKEGSEDESVSRTFEPGETAECDLQRAFVLADEGKATIEEVRYRRRLQDAGTFIHGSRIFRDNAAGAEAARQSIAADGVADLLAVLRREIATLEASTERLAESRSDVEAELKATADRMRRLAADKELWDRDAAAAERTADAFGTEVSAIRKRLAAVEQAVVTQAAELRDAVGRLVERIDAVAPAPSRPVVTP